MKKSFAAGSTALVVLAFSAKLFAASAEDDLFKKHPLPKTPPKVSVAVASSGESWIKPGEAATVKVTLTHPGGPEPIELFFDPGDWTSLVGLEIRDSKGRLQDWKIEPPAVTKPSPSVKIEPGKPVETTFKLSPEATSKIVQGDYTLKAVLSLGLYARRVNSDILGVAVAAEAPTRPVPTPMKPALAAKKKTASAPPAAESPAAEAPASGAGAQAPPTALAPRLSLFVNGAGQSEILKGWPLILKVTVEHPTPQAADLKPITLSSKKGNWTRLVQVEAVDEDGRRNVWPLELAPLVKPEGKITLDARNSAFLAYLLSPKDSRRLEPGNYTLRALITAKKPTGERFVVSQSPGIPVKVSDHPESLTPEQEDARAKLEALYHALKGDKAQAEKSFASRPASGDGRSFSVPVQGQPIPAQPTYVPEQSSGASDILGLLGSFGLGSFGSSYEGFDPSSAMGGMVSGEGEDWSPGAGGGLPEIPGIPEIPLPGIPSMDGADDAGGGGSGEVPPPGNLPGLPGVPVPGVNPGDGSASSGNGSENVNPGAEGDASGNKPENHVAPSGFNGPDMTIRAEWSGSNEVVMHIENGENAVGHSMTQQGPGLLQFRPWDLNMQNLDRELYVAVLVTPGSAANPAKATVKVSYQRSPREPWQSETVELDEAKYHDTWVAFKVDCDSGSLEWIKRFHSSISSYLNGDPEEEEHKTEESAAEENPSGESPAAEDEES